MTIDFGLVVPARPPKDQTGKWLADVDANTAALAGHFRSLWMTDHFFWDGDPTFEAWTVMSFLAGRFPAYEIGPIVLGQGYRNPALLALMASTLQTVSDGRFIMGIGAGWKEDEYLAYDYEFPRAGIRIEQLEDTLNILQKMWAEPGQVTYEGRHYKVVDAWCEPKPDPAIPILIGAGGNKMLRLTAQYADMWNTGLCDIVQYNEKLDILKQHCADLGRDISTLRLTWFGSLAIGATQAQAEQYADQIAGDYGFLGTPDQIAEQMQPFIEAGVDYFLLIIPGLPDPVISKLVIEELLPRVRAL